MSSPLLPSLVAIIGPTASGKTALGEELALHFKGEIVSADAKQIFRGMDIGTAKEKNLRVPQHLIDMKDPEEHFTVADYQQLAYAAIDAILQREAVPFLVGGSMLYAEAVLNGYEFSTRSQLPRYRSLKIGIEIERGELKRRIAQRTEQWLGQGILREIQLLREGGVSSEWLYWCGQEYRYFNLYLSGELSLEEAIRETNKSINEYVKRQYTWWRRHDDVRWVKGFSEAIPVVEAFLQEEGMV